MKNSSTPAPSEKDVGGDQVEPDSTPKDDHSQIKASKDAADKPVDTKTEDQPSKTKDSSEVDSESTKDESKDKDAPASKFDSDLDEWADKRGFGKLSTETERKLAQQNRDNQRAFSQSQQNIQSKVGLKSTIDKAKADVVKPKESDDSDTEFDDTSQLAQEVADLKLQVAHQDYFQVNGLSHDEEKAMGDILQEQLDLVPESDVAGRKAVLESWVKPGNLKNWHTLAKVKVGEADGSSDLDSEAIRNDERNRIAKESQAKGVARGASTVPLPTKSTDNIISDIWSED